MSLSSVFFTALIGFGVWYWVQSRDIKELAYRKAQSACKELDLQLLDQAVALKGVRLTKTRQGLQVVRAYSFDFSSSGEDRYEGKIIMLGRRVEEVQFAPHRLH